MKRNPHRTLGTRLLMSLVLNCSTPLLANLPNHPGVPQGNGRIEQNMRYAPLKAGSVAGEKAVRVRA